MNQRTRLFRRLALAHDVPVAAVAWLAGDQTTVTSPKIADCEDELRAVWNACRIPILAECRSARRLPRGFLLFDSPTPKTLAEMILP